MNSLLTATRVGSRFVGRKHQPELLKRSVAQDCLPFMSRDHFSICFSRGQFQMRTLTSNPIWRFRSCAEPIELQRGDPVDLQTGLASPLFDDLSTCFIILCTCPYLGPFQLFARPCVIPASEHHGPWRFMEWSTCVSSISDMI